MFVPCEAEYWECGLGYFHGFGFVLGLIFVCVFELVEMFILCKNLCILKMCVGWCKVQCNFVLFGAKLDFLGEKIECCVLYAVCCIVSVWWTILALGRCVCLCCVFGEWE